MLHSRKGCQKASKNDQIDFAGVDVAKMKLYRLSKSGSAYWEAWDMDKNRAIIHWGILGERGKSREVRSTLFSSFRKKLEKEAQEYLDNGYSAVAEEDHRLLSIEFKIKGHGSPEDLEKRIRLENRMNETLGWTGLGHCDGGSIGSGSMEIACYVVDFELAKSIIIRDLIDTEFANYTRIFEET